MLAEDLDHDTLRWFEWSGWVDLNHRFPASKAGGDGQTPPHPDDRNDARGRSLPNPDFSPGQSLVRRARHRWTSRQDSNLHQSAFVVRCSSIELREELVCLAGGFPALTSRLDAFGRRHRAVDRTGSVSSSYPALKASKAVTGCLTFWRTRNSSMIPKAGVARGARGGSWLLKAIMHFGNPKRVPLHC
jgi:hypothetical protein